MQERGIDLVKRFVEWSAVHLQYVVGNESEFSHVIDDIVEQRSASLVEIIDVSSRTASTCGGIPTVPSTISSS